MYDKLFQSDSFVVHLSNIVLHIQIGPFHILSDFINTQYKLIIYNKLTIK